MATATEASEFQAQAADFVERFTEAWTKCDPDAFTPLFAPDVHLIHPIEPDTHGIEEARAFMARTMSQVPDLRYDVQGWAATETDSQVLIWGRLYGTLAGKPIEWPLVDRITLADGQVKQRVAYFDPLVVFGQIARRPAAWPGYAKAALARLRS